MHLSRAIPAAMAMTLTLFASAAQAAPTITQSAAGNGPFQLARGADSNVWFTDSPNPGAIGRVTQGGTVTTFTAATSALQNDARPTGITAGPGGLWFTENSKDKIGRITTSGVVSEFSDGSHNDPEGIAAGPDGNLWYTATGSGGAIARITPTGTITEYTAGLTTNGDPRDITAGPDGKPVVHRTGDGPDRADHNGGGDHPIRVRNAAGCSAVHHRWSGRQPWFTESGSSTPAIGRITPAGVVTQFTAGLPAGSVPQDITSGADGTCTSPTAARTLSGRSRRPARSRNSAAA
jgi:streptogramin lyase